MYDATDSIDGYVSLEVSPDLARDAAGTVAEARRLWQIVDRPNLMIKVPGTVEGADAIRQLIADGINVNVTLLFSIDAHARVIEAFIAGLEERAAAGKSVSRIASPPASRALVGRRSSRRVRRCSGRSGRARARRTPPIAT